MASNGWVISGKHTKSGMPLLAGDPHLQTTAPSPLSIGSIQWGTDDYLIGASLIGVPGIAFGRNRNVSLDVTAALADSTDLWLEEISGDETKYKVDNEWRDLEKRTETFKISGKPDRDIDIMSTHRGPLLDFDTLQFNSKLLFGEKVPDADSSKKYSFGWTQATKGEVAVGIINMMSTVGSVKEALDFFDEIGKNGYNGLMGNVILADNQGNIGYQLLAPLPVR